MQSIPIAPKLRPVEPQWIEHQGQRLLMLKDPLALSDKTVLVPQQLAMLLALCDGTRDVEGLQAGLAIRTGVQVSTAQLRQLIAGLDSALLLENGGYRTAVAAALREYHEAPHRTPSHADLVYPSDRKKLGAAIDGYGAGLRSSDLAEAPPSATLTGMVCPHIDYERGGQTYARLWRSCAGLLDDVELVIILGTDHAGSPGRLTLTRQNYATPLGVLPTDIDTVNGLSERLGEGSAFAEELHHVKEHSVELAAVWMHHYLGGRPVSVVPILCGSFHSFTAGDEDPRDNEGLAAALRYLGQVIGERRTLVIAAADLAHVGPAFGDESPVDATGRAQLEAQDAESIKAICRADADEFLAASRRESDARRICGLPPIYLMLKLLAGSKGVAVGYDQCPADANAGSLVSIIGALLYPESTEGGRRVSVLRRQEGAPVLLG